MEAHPQPTEQNPMRNRLLHARYRAELYTCWGMEAGLSPLKSFSLVNSAKCDLVSQISNIKCSPEDTG